MAARRAVLVLNPASANGSTGKLAEGLVGDLARLGLEARLLRTEGPGHATVLTREALQAGEELVVAVGGDGTVNEVVNGLLEQGPSPHLPTLAVVPLTKPRGVRARRVRDSQPPAGPSRRHYRGVAGANRHVPACPSR